MAGLRLLLEIYGSAWLAWFATCLVAQKWERHRRAKRTPKWVLRYHESERT